MTNKGRRDLPYAGLGAVILQIMACSGGKPSMDQISPPSGGTAGLPSTGVGGSIVDPSAGGAPETGLGGIDIAFGGDLAEAGAAGNPEEVIAYCGDGLQNRADEYCDDGNQDSGDGCNATCQLEAFWVCPTPGQPCVYNVECGDGRIGGTETCDDGRDPTTGIPMAGDGCDASCNIEPGYVCPAPNAACRPLCGDGMILGREQCDDGNPTAGDGCDENCQLEPGSVCPPGEPCRGTVCGDGVAEGLEQCDDGNLQPYDGCTPDCTRDPVCGSADTSAGACLASCGDGILLSSAGELCDDGNAVAGDGCSDLCQVEPGYECAAEAPPEYIDLPIIIRDFRGRREDGGHLDFENWSWEGEQPGIVQPLLGSDRKPIYAGTDEDPIPLTTGATAFVDWYHDVPDVNLRFDMTLRLERRDDGSYSMNSATDEPWADLGGFFPIDDQGYGNQTRPNHNFHFTSELRYWFEFKGNETLEFSGDDDVFVFINGRLAVDIGGIHTRRLGRVILEPSGIGQVCDVNDASMLTPARGEPDPTFDDCPNPPRTIDFGMSLGNVYEVVVFQAERKTIESNYWLTLNNFLTGTSTCHPICGDGIVTRDEACDLGKELNTGGHGGCNPDCTIAPYCGDGHVDEQFGEQCDDGVNTSLYGGCAPGCLKGPFCGDGTVQAPYEQCDDGVNDGSYGKCAPSCVYGPRCGDGIKQANEECDEGPQNGKGSCRGDCTLDVLE